MTCPSCGGTLEADVQFCPFCGMQLRASSAGMPTTRVGPLAPEQPVYVPPPLPPATPLDQPEYAAPVSVMSINPPMSTAATVSLVFGIIGWFLLPIIAPIIAVVAGHMARREIAASGGRLGGQGRANAGLVMGYIQLAFTILACIGFFLLALLVPASSS